MASIGKTDAIIAASVGVAELRPPRHSFSVRRSARSTKIFIQRAWGPSLSLNRFYIPTSGLRISTSFIVVTMIFRNSPRDSSESISRLSSAGVKEPRMSRGRLAF